MAFWGRELRNCLIFRDFQGGVVFSHESGQSFRVPEGFLAMYQGSEGPVSQLGTGSKATVILDSSSNPERIEVTYMCEKKQSQPCRATTSPMQAGPENSQTCEVCHVKPAAFCCNCKIPLAFLCDGHCFFEHQSKDPHIPHSILPISAAGRDPDEYQRKFNDLKKGTAELRRNVEIIDQFGQEFSASVDNVISQVQNYKNSVLQWLRTEKEQISTTIETAIKEAQNCLAQGSQYASPLVEALWVLPPEELRMVTFSVTPPDLQSICDAWIIYRNDLSKISKMGQFRVEYCAICCDKIQWRDILTLTCGHYFHSVCVKN